MPSQINLQITGRIDNLICYKVGDKYYMRTAPVNVKQTKATKKRAGEFGKASGIGRCLRQQLLPSIPFPADNKMLALQNGPGSMRCERTKLISKVESNSQPSNKRNFRFLPIILL